MTRYRVTLTPENFGLDKKSRKARMRIIGDLIVAEWKAAARASGLRSTLKPYINAIAIEELSENHVRVALPGRSTPGGKAAMLARMMEFGLGPGGIGTEGPFDMRAQILKAGTRKLRWGKNGPYVNIPFKMDAAKIAGFGGRTAVKAASGLSASVSHSDLAGHRTAWGGKLGPQWAQKIKSHHKTNPLHGLYRFKSTYSKKGGGGSTFGTFRRMSWAGQPWRHPGIKARRIGESVAKAIPAITRGLL
jgi:hypothetical protein